jgi:hypothetical protein
MSSRISIVAALLAFIIGLMAIIADGRVLLLSQDPGYYVIDWLVKYNFIAGMVSALITAPFLRLNHRFARLMALATLISHAVVMLLLLLTYREVVAPDSLAAMTIRIMVWIIIALLLFAGARRNNTPSQI